MSYDRASYDAVRERIKRAPLPGNEDGFLSNASAELLDTLTCAALDITEPPTKLPDGWQATIGESFCRLYVDDTGDVHREPHVRLELHARSVGLRGSVLDAFREAFAEADAFCATAAQERGSADA